MEQPPTTPPSRLPSPAPDAATSAGLKAANKVSGKKGAVEPEPAADAAAATTAVGLAERVVDGDDALAAMLRDMDERLLENAQTLTRFPKYLVALAAMAALRQLKEDLCSERDTRLRLEAELTRMQHAAGSPLARDEVVTVASQPAAAGAAPGCNPQRVSDGKVEEQQDVVVRAATQVFFVAVVQLVLLLFWIVT